MGKFKGRVITEWLKDTNDDRLMRLEEDFTYLDDKGWRWIAKKGNIVDGASIPRAFWSIMGGPLAGKYRRASVLHDVYCKTQDVPYQAVHKMFYEAMLDDEVGKIKAKTMYWAIKLFGPRWSSIV
jgi:hypothetical protein